ncbi:MAG TPA: Dabb family protein [Acidimicrobiales bacterium]
MFRHVVMFRWKDDAPADAAATVSARLAVLPSLIPEIRAYRFGPDAGLADGNFDYVVVADFDDAEGWRRYVVDEHHQLVVTETIRPLISERVAVQYELADPATGVR